MTEVQPLIPAELTSRGLFIVGHARSGTTVLQHALNSSRDVHVFGEANFHNQPGGDAFADWYNAMHLSFRNSPAKGDRCPEVPGPLFEALAHLARHYHWVGDKIAFRDDSLGYDYDLSLRFLNRWFPRSVYVCTLRNPLATLSSNSEMFRPSDLRLYTLSYAKSLLLLANTYFTFDRVLIAHYESLTPASFDRIGAWLETSLDEAMSEYDPLRQTARVAAPNARVAAEVALVSDGYEKLVALLDPNTMRIPKRGAFRDLQLEFENLVSVLSGRLEEVA